MAVNQIPKISDLPEPPDRLVGDQERFDVLTFNSLKAQKKMVNEDLNKALATIRANGTYARINARYFDFDLYGTP